MVGRGLWDGAMTKTKHGRAGFEQTNMRRWGFLRLKGKSTGNHRFSNEIYGMFLCFFPLNQSIDLWFNDAFLAWKGAHAGKLKDIEAPKQADHTQSGKSRGKSPSVAIIYLSGMMVVVLFKTNSGWWFGTLFFPSIGNVIIPIDSYFSEG